MARLQRPFVDVVKEDMKSVGVKGAKERVGWRETIGPGPCRRKQEGKKKDTSSYGVGLPVVANGSSAAPPSCTLQCVKAFSQMSFFVIFFPA